VDLQSKLQVHFVAMNWFQQHVRFCIICKDFSKIKKGKKKKISSPPFEKVKTAFLAWRQKKWKMAKMETFC
jgi:hypothetical protein